MNRTYHNGLLVFHYDEKVEEQRTNTVYTTLAQLSSELKEKEIKGIFISLKHAPLSQKSSDLDHFVKQMDKLSQKLGLPLALGDYKKEMFEALKPLSAPTQVKLFQNVTTAVLFLNPRFFKKQLTILLFEEDQNIADRLSAELVKAGYSIAHAKTLEDFKQKASAKGYDMTIMQNALNLCKSSFSIQPSLALSRELIVNLPVFIDTAVDSLVTITGLDAQKVKHAVQAFDNRISTDVVIASMRFKGDISGTFFLIFPRSLAHKALEAMLGESVNKDDSAAILDGIAEICNIITGSAKTLFAGKKLKVLFELPKTYLTLALAVNDASSHNGVWIEMQLNSQPFYMFVTK